MNARSQKIFNSRDKVEMWGEFCKIPEVFLRKSDALSCKKTGKEVKLRK